MKDGPFRRAVKRVARWRFEFDLHLSRTFKRVVGRGPSYVLGGTCGRCARCCEAPTLQVGPLLWSLPLLRRLFLAWQEAVNGFVLVERQRDGHLLVFRCTHFDRETGSCDSYDSRPGICRDYPRALLDQPHPEMLPGCGYRPLAVKAGRMLRVLRDQPLTAEQGEKLRKGLFLE